MSIEGREGSSSQEQEAKWRAFSEDLFQRTEQFIKILTDDRMDKRIQSSELLSHYKQLISVALKEAGISRDWYNNYIGTFNDDRT